IPNTLNKGILAANPNYQKWVANTPSDTEAFGLTYQQRHFEAGIFHKRVGGMWEDLALARGAPPNQGIPLAPFPPTNIYFNYILANRSHFRETKLKLSMNNVFDNHNIVGVTQAANTAATYTPGPNDQLTLLPGRSIAATITVGYSPRGQ